MVPDFNIALGEVFLGAMSATQSDMYNVAAPCYVNALTVQEEIVIIFAAFDPGVIMNRFQIIQIKI